MQRVTDAELEVYKPTNSGSTPDFTVPAADLESVSISVNLQNLTDQATLTLNNTGGTYTDTNPITSGDRLHFRTKLSGETSLSDRWVAVARTRNLNKAGPNKTTLTLKAQDFVFAVMGWRTITNAWESTNPSAILDDALSTAAPEIDRSGIQTVGPKTDYFANGEKVLELAKNLAERGDAVLDADGKTIIFKPLSEVPAEWTFKPSDADLPYRMSERDDHVVNEVRAEGGRSFDVDDSQTTQSSYTTVTSTSRIQHQLDVRKSEIARIDLWTRKTGSGEDVTVRLQADDGGTPTAPGSRQSDIVNKTLAPAFLSDGGYTTFLLADHDLPESNPWMLIESSGSTGQDIGVDSNGNPTYKAMYPYPLTSVVTDQSSVDEYRRRESRLNSRDAETRKAVRDAASSKLAHNNAPKHTFTFTARSTRAHNLSTGDVIAVSEPEVNASGDFIVSKVSDTYDGTRLSTEITAQEVSTL